MAVLVAAGLVVPAQAARDSLSVVGVAVRAGDGSRVAGHPVKLVAASQAIGLLAEDRTSSNGVFNLYTTNIGGDIGNLFVIADAPDVVATPITVTVGPGRNGFIDVRAGDLMFRTLPAAPTLGADEAAEHMAALLKTQAVLLNAGLIDRQAADAEASRRGAEITSRVALSVQATPEVLRRRTNDKIAGFDLAIDPGRLTVMSRTVGRGGGR